MDSTKLNYTSITLLVSINCCFYIDITLPLTDILRLFYVMVFYLFVYTMVRYYNVYSELYIVLVVN